MNCQTANPSVHTDAARRAGISCVLEHVTLAARGVTACHRVLPATKMSALAMPR